MPEDSKKNDKKNAKEQRKPRQRHQQARAEKKPEKAEENKSSAPKVPQKPPVYESPPPEFFKNLKRETDEILKITEEENTKYKKKEIQSNWSKYEVPIESYEEIDEQENLGADYEKLIEAPLSVGGHFQFKHEKSWDITTGPSPYEKYFELNMEDLNISLCTIPFYERNNIELSTFSETDVLTMNNRSIRFKQKYFNDKSFSTPETEAHDKILSSLRDNMKDSDSNSKEPKTYNKGIEINSEENSIVPLIEEKLNLAMDINLDPKNEPVSPIDSNKIVEEHLSPAKIIRKIEPAIKSNETGIKENETDDHFVHDDFIFGNTKKSIKVAVEKVETLTTQIPEFKPAPPVEVKTASSQEDSVVPKLEAKPAPQIETKLVPIQAKVETKAPVEIKASPSIQATTPPAVPKVAESPLATKKNPVIESPEDLEKWLDDFLDG